MATTCYGYMHENAEYQEFSERIRDTWKQINDIESKQRQHIWDIQALTRTLDTTRTQMFKFEDVSNKVDKELERLTHDDSEGWMCTYGKGLDLVTEKVVSICVLISNSKVDIEVLKERNKALNKEQDALGDKLRAEFHAKEEAVTNA